ncbi:PepSY domain-containing protein [Sphingomonas ginkgonis]|uniref:PepSY domain-containing protein n=1 Tax=Sphingomonas ginkgonis TaxID=2315330 RepID=A0A3R9X6X0_9SPHN|nr:PepSY-associated TM helix domain-containing protein [Sphingomonas ginkgonis]RST30265.1 PepSY domain-containing protein [Sphingomonas ginkgonis]
MTTAAEPRSLWILLHRWFGLGAMLFLALAALTGCILVFAAPLDRALNADLTIRRSSAPALPPLVAVERFAAGRPAMQLLGFPLRQPVARTVAVDVGPLPGAAPLGFDQIFLDPADGSLVGTRLKGPAWDRRGFVAGLAEFHYDLLAGKWGRWLMGVLALGWLLTNFVGVWLTWPAKAPYWSKWKRMWKASPSSSLPRFLLDLHRASGLWLLAGLSILALTSVCMNFFSEAYEPTVTRLSPLRYDLFDRDAPFPDGARPTLRFTDALRLVERQAAADRQPWIPATMVYRPDWNFYGVTFTRDGTLDYRALGPVYLYVDARSGALRHRVDPYIDSLGLKLIRVLYPLHSGQVAGWPTELLIFVLGLSTIEMSITGFYIWLKKRRSRRAQAAATRRRLAAAAA